MVRVFEVPVIWQMAGTMKIEADTEEQAKELALTTAPLPTDGDYLDESCIIAEDENNKIISYLEEDF